MPDMMTHDFAVFCTTACSNFSPASWLKSNSLMLRFHIAIFVFSCVQLWFKYKGTYHQKLGETENSF